MHMNKDKIRLSPAASILPNDEGVLLRSDLGDFQLHGKVWLIKHDFSKRELEIHILLSTDKHTLGNKNN